MTTSPPEDSENNNSPQLIPLSTNNRINAMDILRGLALVGILLMNIEWFGRSMSTLGSFDPDLTGLDHAAGWLVRCFIEGKFYKIFALLFGMGFAVMLIRAKDAGRPFGAWFVRRMVVLYAFGLFHMFFLWGGDILHDYAFAGLLLLGWIFLLKRPRFQKYDNPRSFLKIGLVWLAVPTLLSVIAGFGFGVAVDRQSLTEIWQQEQHIAVLVDQRMTEVENSEYSQNPDASLLTEREAETDSFNSSSGEVAEMATEQIAEAEDEVKTEQQLDEEIIAQQVNDIVEGRQEFSKDEKEEITAFTEGSYWQATEYRIGFAGFMLMLSPVFALTMYLPIFLLGYWFISSGVLKNHQQHKVLFKPMAWIGLGLGLSFTVGGLLITQHPAAENVMMLLATGNTLFFIGQYVTAAGYLGLVVSLLGSAKWAKRLNIFAPLGRMALTNYITHSVILTSIFYGYAGGMFGQISRAPQMLIVFVIIICQLFLSTWWLKRYQFGPLEWLWRSLTYKQLQPMRLATT
ncbi:MAG: DUF418 domain-containing protein [Colwellia sp.]|nr:DUF418 domain-containing protein [Colwellia sp.]